MASAVNPAVQIAISIRTKLSQDSQVLLDSETTDFKDSMKRYSDVGIQTPSAIFKPACENDIVTIVSPLSPILIVEDLTLD